MRSTLRIPCVLGVFLGLATGMAGAPVYAQSAKTVYDLPNPYREIHDWAQLPPGRVIGATTAIAIDRDGESVWVLDRCGALGSDTCIGSSAAPLMKFDPSGKLVASFGAGMFVYPHGMSVDREGNIWVVDEGKNRKGEQVVKLSPTGKVLLTLGKTGVASPGPDTFNQPSYAFAAPDGNIFVADGHGGESPRVMKFSKDGTFIKAWGKRGTGPGDFRTPHSVVTDAKGRLFVADKGGQGIQIFDQDGTFLMEWRQFGNPHGIAIDRNGLLYATGAPAGMEQAKGTEGVSIGEVSDGKVIFFVPDTGPADPKQAREGIAVDRNGNMYLAKSGAGGLLKLVKK